MVIAVSHEQALKGRRIGRSPSNGEQRWYIDYIGEKVQQVEDRPEANLIEMDSNQTVVPHFHQVNQFQIMASGSGSLGRNSLGMVALHYVDNNTAYGPIKSGPYGMTLFTIRAQSDPSATYLHQPGYKEALKPSRRRYIIAENITPSVEAVMTSRKAPLMEDLLPAGTDTDDGLGAHMLRLGGDMGATGPDPARTSGQYYLVLNGSLVHGDGEYGKWSMLFVGRDEPPLAVQAGTKGVETLVLELPRLNA